VISCFASFGWKPTVSSNCAFMCESQTWHWMQGLTFLVQPVWHVDVIKLLSINADKLRWSLCNVRVEKFASAHDLIGEGGVSLIICRDCSVVLNDE